MISTLILASMLTTTPITHDTMHMAVLDVLKMQPITMKAPPKDDPDTKRSRLFRWSVMLAAGLADGYTTDKALANGHTEGGVLAKHFVKGPGIAPYAYGIGIRVLLAKLYDLSAKHKKTDANVSAALHAGWTIPAIVGNIQNAKVQR